MNSSNMGDPFRPLDQVGMYIAMSALTEHFKESKSEQREKSGRKFPLQALSHSLNRFVVKPVQKLTHKAS